MKTIRNALFLLLLTLIATQPATAASKTNKIKITFIGASLVENNHVGNEWWTGGYVNGKEIQEGDAVTLSVKSTGTITLKAEAQEQDKIPDDGQVSASLKVASITKTVNKALTVTVVENRGRYSGNAAKWKFSFKLERVS
ncbi:hypothetical protein [Paenibacillus sacheonensis]|uniref:Uncharacterized protein n=1 Tax=Paenibacillus sacheonensis TaxID=742054 RepID=A0A7X4YLU2_9BACL|nr:hypothetical protein [Paenibacillus sacheonensis]MBM7565958.1 hypothetical protein [Paenibacillus sacheonensis]NBC68728.1 hypothetical protein [Paenibacillus sacheonensis]